MGWMPCLACDQRFKGEAGNLYLQLYVGDQVEAYRFVVCEGCVEELVVMWRSRALWRDADGEWQMADGELPLEARRNAVPEPSGRSKGKRR